MQKTAFWTTFVRSFHALGPFSSCITPHVLRKCALVDRHGLTKSLCQRKRRQSVSGVEGDKAADAPDDLADTELEKTEPFTSGLGKVTRAPARVTLE